MGRVRFSKPKYGFRNRTHGFETWTFQFSNPFSKTRSSVSETTLVSKTVLSLLKPVGGRKSTVSETGLLVSKPVLFVSETHFGFENRTFGFENPPPSTWTAQGRKRPFLSRDGSEH